MKNIKTPKSCDICRYGRTWDSSVDDLNTHCFILGYTQNWSDDFPRGSLRMRDCPMPHLTDEQIRVGEKKLEVQKLKELLVQRMIYGKTKLIKTRNLSRFKSLNKKIYTGAIPWEWLKKKQLT